MSDEMDIIHPKTGAKRFMVDAHNEVVDNHECTFVGDHEDRVDINDVCIVCGKKLYDVLAADWDPYKPRTQIVIQPSKNQEDS